MKTELEQLRYQAVSDTGDLLAKQNAFNAELSKLVHKTNLTVADIDKLIAKVRSV